MRATEPLPFCSITIEPGLELKQLEISQAEELYRLIVENYDYLIAWLPFPSATHSSEDSKKFIVSKLNERKSRESYGYGIYVNGTLIGHIELKNINSKEKLPEIGYWISKDMSGKNISTKATKALTTLAVDTLGLQKVAIRAHPDNIASNKVAKKSGYKYTHQCSDNEGQWNVYKYEASSRV